MSEKTFIPQPILKIKSDPEIIRVVGKKGGDVSIQDINLQFIMATLWWEGNPQLETFFNIMELTIKRALQEVHPHEKLVLDYTYTANDTLEDASEIMVEIENVEADGEVLKVEGDIIVLSGNDDRGFFKKLTSFIRKVQKNIHQEI
jgi:gamma-glutamyltranspeptidase